MTINSSNLNSTLYSQISPRIVTVNNSNLTSSFSQPINISNLDEYVTGSKEFPKYIYIKEPKEINKEPQNENLKNNQETKKSKKEQIDDDEII